MLSNILSVPGISSAVTYSFDLGVYDSATGKYYVTDRTNKAIDWLDVNNGLVVNQFKPAGLTGCAGQMTVSPGGVVAQNVAIPTCTNTAAGIFPSFTVNNDQSGPDGIDIVGNTLFVGDVNKLLVLNKTTGAVIANIPIASTPTGLRADEGCFDPVNHLYAISTPGDNNPFMTILDTTNAEANPPTAPTVKARLIMDNPAGTASGGLEACVFDTGPGGTGKLFVNNDGNNAVPGSPASRGEMDGIPVTSLTPLTGGGNVQYTTLAGISQYPLTDVGATGECDPTGIALGPGTDIGAMCRTGTIGRSLNFLILDKTTGAVAATVAGAGGGDQITYDAVSGNWFLGTSRMTASGNSCGGGSAACPLTPKVTIVNGASRTLSGKVPSGNNSHSMATGGGLVFSPFTNGPSATAGGVGFPNGGIAVFFSH